MSLLLTRALSDSQTLEAALAPHGIDCVISPLLRIEPTHETHHLSTADGVIATSRHAFTGQPPIDAPLYVVGTQTAQLAQQLGWPKPAYVARTCQELRGALNFAHGAKLLYLRAEHVKEDLARIYTDYQWHEVISYRAAAQPLSDAAREGLSLGRISHVALYSARTARLFEAELNAHSLAPPLSALCFSRAVADALTLPIWHTKHCAKSPTGDAMQELMIEQYKRDAFANKTVIASHDD
jgi:uroporphyrinogen-III synthase